MSAAEVVNTMAAEVDKTMAAEFDKMMTAKLGSRPNMLLTKRIMRIKQPLIKYRGCQVNASAPVKSSESNRN